jgi:tRNA/rRNA methyltransferase
MARPVIVLVTPQMGENIGAAARIMANFDLEELRIVAPRDGWPNEKAAAMATGAVGIIERATVFDDLSSAIADLTQVYATTARPREMIKRVAAPREAAGEIARAAGPVGIVFGPERSGLSNEDVGLADTIVSIPVGWYKSLNIAQAVAIVAYECFVAGHGMAMPQPEAPMATKGDVAALFEALERALDARGFFRPEEKRPGMVRNLRNLIERQALYEQDVRTLHGVVKALTRRGGDI